jgi:mono/diheme cytochrome c family protein
MKLRSQLILTALVPLAIAATSVTLKSIPQTGSSRDHDIERGKYLVEEVAKCPECHTPRDKQNQLDRDRWLQGAPIWIQPVIRTPNWADSAPTLAGLPNYTDQQVERVLERGEGVEGMPIQPPMHIYHMDHDDARVIIAHLRSLRGPLPAHR